MLREMFQQFSQCEKQASEALYQLCNIRMKIAEACKMERLPNSEIVQVPFVAYEMQLERNNEEKQAMAERYEQEKDKMRKHYRNLIMWICIPFILFMLATFGTVWYFFSNYDFATYTQDGEGLNNIANKTTQGDIIYEPTPENNSTKE